MRIAVGAWGRSVTICMGRLQSESGSNLTLLERRSPPTPMGSLLVDRENNRMGGRIDVEADDVFELLGELRVRRQLERADAMRRELVGLEDTLHRSQGHSGPTIVVARLQVAVYWAPASSEGGLRTLSKSSRWIRQLGGARKVKKAWLLLKVLAIVREIFCQANDAAGPELLG